ncbi:NYN domain-containing protein [Candidatus Micrarchaeota archaeon CG11_big_fil_rev_8_21_14_0_20_47_5]|nr:MAG: hypothetical protein AUJ17_00175 [Candidatus Micrarchaeota archaeon CG1_02_47_40]PIN83211.1 MAG: NYN domain-containing protein [Candidatus Micrarchaeota archaeon CG11_big_fil_rev_8_21_14_0_20_47_5]
MTEKLSERAAIFIDGSNFYHSVKDTLDVHDNEVDFRKLIEELKRGRLLISVYYYNASLDRSYNEEIYWKQQKFFSELRGIPGFHVILCHMRKILKAGKEPEFKVKGDDIHLATDMLSMAYEHLYDTAILVSGDGDFVPLVRKIRKLDKKVENAYFLISCSNFLKKECDFSILLDEVITEKCLKQSKD